MLETFLGAETLSSTIRLSVPLILACLAGLWSERAGIVDIGLEGKMLIAAFAAAATRRLHRECLAGAVARHHGVARLLAGTWLCFDQPEGQPGRLRRGHQHARGGACCRARQ